MKFLKKRNLAMVLGGSVAGFMGLLATLAVIGSPAALAYPAQSNYCDSCHGYPSSTLKVSVDKTAVSVAPLGTFTVTASFTGGNTAGTTEINWPTTFPSTAPRDNSLFNPSPRSSDSSNAGTGSSTATLTAPSTAGTYTIRVYASRKSPLETDYKDIKVTVATPAPATYTLTYVAGANGTLSGTASQSIASGGSGTAVTAIANTGYHFVNWSDGSTANPRTDTNVTSSKSVTANFAINTYTLSYAAGANGSLTGTTSQTVNYLGNGTAVTAVPATGYHFVNWSDSSTQNPRTDTNVTANKSVTANFAINTYTLNYTAGANGTVTGTASQTVNYNSSGTAVTAVANTGYHFVNWSDGKTANPRTDAGVTANIAVTANFAADAVTNYTLTYIAGPNGSISGAASQTVPSGASGTAVTAVPTTGYHFVNWSDGKTANPRTDSNVTANVNVTANFVADAVVTYSVGVAANPTNGGSVSGGGTVNSGASVTVTATANSGYTFSSWTENGAQVSTSASYTFTAGSSRNLVANFAVEIHTITVTSGANGTITPGTETVNHASDATFTITASAGYHVASIVVDGSPLLTALATSPTTTYTFTNVTSNHSISATFATDAPVTDSVGPVTSNLKISPKITKRNNPTQVTLTALVNDSATGNSSVAGAEYWIDAGPHVAMTASVAAFTSSTVQVNATITLAGLTPGRHIVYVRGQDQEGNWGPSARIGFRVIASSSPSASVVQFKATAESSDDDWNQYTDDTPDEIEVDENSKGDVIQIVDHLTSGQDVILWPNGSSEYTDSH